MMGAIIIFEKNIFIVSDYRLATKLVGLGAHCLEVAKKIKCQKMNVNILQPN
jgi:hypothetical protein